MVHHPSIRNRTASRTVVVMLPELAAPHILSYPSRRLLGAQVILWPDGNSSFCNLKWNPYSSSDQKAVFLLGGAIGERKIEGWLPPRKGPSSSSREVVVQCCAFEVAMFLLSIARERRKVVRNLSSPRSGAEAQEGMARRTLGSVER